MLEMAIAFLNTPLGAGLAAALALGLVAVGAKLVKKLTTKFLIFASKTENTFDDEIALGLDKGVDVAEDLVSDAIEAERDKRQ